MTINQTEKLAPTPADQPDIRVQIEEQLTLADQAPNVALRMLAVAKGMALAFKWNQDKGGTPHTWDMERDLAYKQQVLLRLLEACARNLQDFAQASDVPLEAGSGPQGQPRREVWLSALTEQAITNRKGKGKRLRGGGTVAGNHRAVEFVNLLYRAGGLTRDQLRFLSGFQRPQSVAAQHETSETINLLLAARLATPHECDTWKNSQAELYTLSQAGQTFYDLLHRRDFTAPGQSRPYNLDLSLQQLYGTNQVMASLSGACKVATSTGQLRALAVEITRRPAWYYQNQEQEIGLRLDWEDYDYRLDFGDIRGNNRSIAPSGVARLVLDEAQLGPSLLQQANLTERPDTRFAHSRYEGNAVWPLLLEYDWAADNPDYLAPKVAAYTEFYNIQRLWPEKWLGRFPVILVVTAGGPRHLLSLMLSVRDQLRRVNRPRQPQEWWFTTVSWFTAAYQDYLGTFNNRRKPRPPVPPEAGESHRLAHKARIWLPLSALGSEPPENLHIALSGLNFLILNEDPADKQLVATNLAEVGPGDWVSKMTALPIPHST